MIKMVNENSKNSKKIQKNDFVEINYTGIMANEGYIFDTTEEAVAKEQGLFNPGVKYGSVITCVGERMVLSGLDDSLEGKQPGDEYDVEFNSGDSFGPRSAKMIKLVPANVFKKQGIQPQVGLQVTMDGAMGMIKTISGGRVIVDFNHPLAAKDLKYHVKIGKIVTDIKDQIKAILELKLNIKKEDVFVKADSEKKTAELTLNFELPKDAQDKLVEYIQKLVDVKEISFKVNPDKEGADEETKSNI
jgi:FKBP-type peptidyl-prolyl cis-trans isomerase 2